VVDNDVGGNGGHPGKGAATDQLRRHNLAAVLGHVHLAGPVSRSELVAATGLNRSTIADLIRELASLMLVAEGPGVAAAGPGRPSSLVHVRPEGAVVLAVELTVDSIGVATVGLGGQVYNRVHVARPREDISPEEAANHVTDLGRPLLAALPASHRFLGVGVGVAGIARRSDGFLHLAPNLGWRGAPIGELISGALGIPQPVWVANEADMGALAEHRRGTASGIRNLIYVSGEVGIGAGIIVDGQPLLGAAGYAGEAGHTLVNPAGRPCRCGAVGCWETEAGEAALLRLAGVRTTTTGLRLLKTVADRAALGDSTTLAALAEVGRWLGLGIGNLINLFNPEVVVLGGLYQRFFRYLEEAVVKGMRSQALAAACEDVTIVPSALRRDAVLVGAAELALTPILSDPAGAGRIAPGGPGSRHHLQDAPQGGPTRG